MATPTSASSSTKPAPLHRRYPAAIESEILACLPVKTLKRFECVCKSWSNLFSSPQFHNQHYNRSHQKPPLLITLKGNKNMRTKPDPRKSTLIRFPGYIRSQQENFVYMMLNLNKHLPQEFYTIDKLTQQFSTYTNNDGTLTPVDHFEQFVSQPMFDGSMTGKPFMLSCRGLICIASWSITYPPMLIINPSTHQLIQLPPTKQPNRRVGFGYVSSTDEYKVVRFFADGIKVKSRCEVFTLGTTHWRNAKFAPYKVCDGTAPFLHGAVHCLPEISRDGVQETDVIAAFDIQTEQYRETIHLPAFYYSLGTMHGIIGHGVTDPYNFTRLTLLGGSLCWMFDYGQQKCGLDLYLLKNYANGEWVKEYTIDVSSIYSGHSLSLWAYPTDNMVDEYIFLNCSDEEGVNLLGYDPKHGTVNLKRGKEWGAAFFVETLYPLTS